MTPNSLISMAPSDLPPVGNPWGSQTWRLKVDPNHHWALEEKHPTTSVKPVNVTPVHGRKNIPRLLDPPFRVSKNFRQFKRSVFFLWVFWGTNFRPLEDSGIYPRNWRFMVNSIWKWHEENDAGFPWFWWHPPYQNLDMSVMILNSRTFQVSYMVPLGLRVLIGTWKVLEYFFFPSWFNGNFAIGDTPIFFLNHDYGRKGSLRYQVHA